MKVIQKSHYRNNRFDFCVSNPPYQKSNNGHNKDIWPEYISVAGLFSNTFTFIHPGRWLSPKKNMEKVRSQIIDSGLKYFYFTNQSLFKNAEISGGLSITMFKRDYDENIMYQTNLNNCRNVYKENTIFFYNEIEEEIYHSVEKMLDENTLDTIRLGSIGPGQKTNFKLIKKEKDCLQNPVKIWACNPNGKNTKYQWYWIEKNDLDEREEKLLTGYKVLISKIGHVPVGSRPANIFNNNPMILAPGETNSGGQYVFPMRDKKESELFVSMMKTKFIRALMYFSQRDIHVRGFENIPNHKLLINMLEKDEMDSFTDEWFYKKFNLSQETVCYIESRISRK